MVIVTGVKTVTITEGFLWGDKYPLIRSELCNIGHNRANIAKQIVLTGSIIKDDKGFIYTDKMLSGGNDVIYHIKVDDAVVIIEPGRYILSAADFRAKLEEDQERERVAAEGARQRHSDR